MAMFMGSLQGTKHRVHGYVHGFIQGAKRRVHGYVHGFASGCLTSCSWLCSWVRFRVLNIVFMAMLMDSFRVLNVVFMAMFMGCFRVLNTVFMAMFMSSFRVLNTVFMAMFMGSFRVLNTHVLIRQLNPKLLNLRCKIVFMLRNAKDTAVSFYHHHLKLPEYEYKGDWANYLDLFLAGKGKSGMCRSVRMQRGRANYLDLFLTGKGKSGMCRSVRIQRGLGKLPRPVPRR